MISQWISHDLHDSYEDSYEDSYHDVAISLITFIKRIYYIELIIKFTSCNIDVTINLHNNLH